MEDNFTLENSEDIVEAITKFYYQSGDIDNYIKCLQWISEYVADDNVNYQIKSVFDLLEEDEIEQLSYDENMSYEIMEALEEHYTYDDGLDVQSLINTLNELNTYCESEAIKKEIDQLCREHNLCPVDYGIMIYKNPNGDNYNPYENGFMQCQKCGYIIY